MRSKITISICAITVACLIATCANAGLVAYWTFDETSGETAGDSADSHDGTISGATHVNNGSVNWALNFDGIDDYVSVPDSDAFTTNAGTLAAWIKLDSWGNESGRIMSQVSGGVTSGNAKGFEWAMNITSHCFAFLLYNNSSYCIVNSANESLSLNSWYYVAVTWNGAQMTAYINGSQSGNVVSQTVNPANPAVNLHIGEKPDHHTGPFDGYIDDVRFYDSALSQEEIAALMPEPATIILLGLGGLLIRRKK
jgi:hypothetical protein